MRPVVGIDLSLVDTGVALLIDGEEPHYESWKSELRGWPRVDYIVQSLRDLMRRCPEDAEVFIEGYAFCAKGSSVFQIAEIGGIVRWCLWCWGWKYTDVAPTTLKKWATGSGRAKKPDMVLAAKERFQYHGTNHNVADAILLAHYGKSVLDG